jgi:hypothetical protein
MAHLEETEDVVVLRGRGREGGREGGREEQVRPTDHRMQLAFVQPLPPSLPPSLPCLRRTCPWVSPQMLTGHWTSRSMGWERKVYRRGGGEGGKEGRKEN